jgi:hypothetical protein
MWLGILIVLFLVLIWIVVYYSDESDNDVLDIPRYSAAEVSTITKQPTKRKVKLKKISEGEINVRNSGESSSTG